MRTTVTKIGFGVIASAILTTMALGAGSAADAAELPINGQGSTIQYGPQYDGRYGSYYSPQNSYGPQNSYNRPQHYYRPATRPVSTVPTTSAPATVSATTATTAPASQVLAQINRVRAGAGAKALTMSTQLVASAHQHNLTMAGGCGLAHQCSGETDAGARISAQGLRWNTYAENIGYGGPVAATDAGKATMAVRITQNMIDEVAPNDGHRRNILNSSLGQIGIDVYRDAKGTVWITQDFSN